MEATKRPTRDYQSLSETPWDLWDVIYARRSHRKYLPMEAGDDFARSMRETVDLALSVRGAAEDSILVVTEPREVDAIRSRAYRGLHGKINLWLMRASLGGFLVLALPHDDVRSQRPRKLPLTSMAAEDSVLWLTEAGLGSCWLGGVSQRELRKAMGFGGETTVPAIISFGRPKARVEAKDLDHVLYRSLSRKRKPLAGISSTDRFGEPYRTLEEPPAKGFSAGRVQDITGLLANLEGDRQREPEVPLGLALEACLEAARVAPNAGNAQNWHFVAVTDEERLAELRGYCGAVDSWRAAVVGSGEPAGFESRMLDRPFWMLDVPIALSHISLMAASMGLGVEVCIDGVDEAAVNGSVGLPSSLRSVGVVGLL